jgi:hypothetical protein
MPIPETFWCTHTEFFEIEVVDKMTVLHIRQLSVACSILLLRLEKKP